MHNGPHPTDGAHVDRLALPKEVTARRVSGCAYACAEPGCHRRSLDHLQRHMRAGIRAGGAHGARARVTLKLDDLNARMRVVWLR
jgi:hypothetical protein